MMSIVISGNPGTGKHTIAHQISQRLGLSIIDINEVAKSEGLFEENKGTNDVDIEKLEKILRNKTSERNPLSSFHWPSLFCIYLLHWLSR